MLSKIIDSIGCISSWIDQCIPQSNGRPLVFEAEKKLMNNKKTELFDWIQKFEYLYIEEDLQVIKTESNILDEKWKNSMKKINGADENWRKINK